MVRDIFRVLVDHNAIKGEIIFPSSKGAGGKGCVILCHGIPGGTRDLRDPGYAWLAEGLANDGYCAVIFNFRGAGESEGDFDMRGWMDDLRAVAAVVRSRIGLPPVLWGFSAGGAVSVCVVAEDNDFAGLMLCGCPAEFSGALADGGADRFLEHARAIGIVRRADFPPDRAAWADGFRIVCPEKKIAGCGALPKLVIHGDDDDVVPVAHAYRLYDRALAPKELLVIKGGGHRLRLNEEAMEAAREWLGRWSFVGG